jgi:hypothetical protein
LPLKNRSTGNQRDARNHDIFLSRFLLAARLVLSMSDRLLTHNVCPSVHSERSGIVSPRALHPSAPQFRPLDGQESCSQSMLLLQCASGLRSSRSFQARTTSGRPQRAAMWRSPRFRIVQSAPSLRLESLGLRP